MCTFSAVAKNLYAKAQASVHFDAYCSGYNPADCLDEEEDPAPPAPGNSKKRG